MGHAPRRRARRAGRDEAAVEEAQHVDDLVRRPAQRGHEAIADPAQGRVLPVVAPAGPRQRLHRVARLGFSRVDLGPRGASGHPPPQGRHCSLRQSREGEHEIDQRVALRRPAERVQAAPDLSVLQLAQVPVHVEDEVVERLAVGLRVDAEIAV